MDMFNMNNDATNTLYIPMAAAELSFAVRYIILHCCILVYHALRITGLFAAVNSFKI